MNKVLRTANGLIAAAVIAGTSFIATGGVAGATTGYNLTVPIETIIAGSEGTTHEITSKDVDDKYLDMECNVNAVAKNQESVHPNNDLTVTSGNTFVVLEDVEREGHVTTQAQGTITLGSDVTVSVTLGKDRIFSGGMEVNVSCTEPEIEVCRDGETITIKESERKSDDEDAPCPESTINVCRNGKVVVIKESDKLDSDEAAPCPVYVNVCRDDKVVRILEEDMQADDTAAPCEVPMIKVCRDGVEMMIDEKDFNEDTETKGECPEVLGESKTLPNTGPGHVIAGVTGASFVGSTLIAQRRMRRR